MSQYSGLGLFIKPPPEASHQGRHFRALSVKQYTWCVYLPRLNVLSQKLLGNKNDLFSHPHALALSN